MRCFQYPVPCGTCIQFIIILKITCFVFLVALKAFLIDIFFDVMPTCVFNQRVFITLSL